jgi:hypothetical protein
MLYLFILLIVFAFLILPICGLLGTYYYYCGPYEFVTYLFQGKLSWRRKRARLQFGDVVIIPINGKYFKYKIAFNFPVIGKVNVQFDVINDKNVPKLLDLNYSDIIIKGENKLVDILYFE